MAPPSLRRRREDAEPSTDGFWTSTSLLLLVLRLPSRTILVPSFSFIPDRRGGSGSEERLTLRLLLTPEGEGIAAVEDRAATADLPKSEKDMIVTETFPETVLSLMRIKEGESMGG